MKIKLQEWEQKEKAALNLKATTYNNDTFDENQKLEKEESKATLQDITPRENESILKIGGYLFTTKHNIESLDFELDLNIQKTQSINKNYYIALGEVEKKINFNATIFIEELRHFNGFIEKVEKREPLSFQSLIFSKIKKILITDFKSSTREWLLDNQRNATFFMRDFSISGVVIE